MKFAEPGLAARVARRLKPKSRLRLFGGVDRDARPGHAHFAVEKTAQGAGGVERLARVPAHRIEDNLGAFKQGQIEFEFEQSVAALCQAFLFLLDRGDGRLRETFPFSRRFVIVEIVERPAVLRIRLNAFDADVGGVDFKLFAADAKTLRLKEISEHVTVCRHHFVRSVRRDPNQQDVGVRGRVANGQCAVSAVADPAGARRLGSG